MMESISASQAIIFYNNDHMVAYLHAKIGVFSNAQNINKTLLSYHSEALAKGHAAAAAIG